MTFADRKDSIEPVINIGDTKYYRVLITEDGSVQVAVRVNFL